jgi:hypothetical protein
MATKHYIDWEEDGKKTPLHPTLVKIARFISKRTGEDTRDVLDRILNECFRSQIGTPEGVERFHASCDAHKRYCEAEGLDEETFDDATLTATLKRKYRELRRDWSAL